MKLLVISNMWPGPRKPYFGVFVETRVRAYGDAGINVEVVANRDPRRGAFWGLLKYSGLLVRSIWAAWRGRPDIIEGHYLVPTAFITSATARLVRRPYVLYAHGSDLAPPRFLAGSLGRVLRGAAEVHTNSEDSRARLEMRFSGVTAVVIPAGIELARFPVGRGKREPIVAYVGNLDPVKGPDLLVRALGQLRRIDWTCRVAGVGPMEEQLKSLAESLSIAERIEWLGAVEPDRVGVVYRDARVAVVPSRRDALGQVAIEALASGTPVVVTGVGGLRSVPNADCGSVVIPNDPAALASAIERWVTTPPAAAVVSAARARAEDFDARVLAREAADRFEDIVGQTSA